MNFDESLKEFKKDLNRMEECRKVYEILQLYNDKYKEIAKNIILYNKYNYSIQERKDILRPISNYFGESIIIDISPDDIEAQYKDDFKGISHMVISSIINLNSPIKLNTDLSKCENLDKWIETIKGNIKDSSHCIYNYNKKWDIVSEVIDLVDKKVGPSFYIGDINNEENNSNLSRLLYNKLWKKSYAESQIIELLDLLMLINKSRIVAEEGRLDNFYFINKVAIELINRDYINNKDKEKDELILSKIELFKKNVENKDSFKINKALLNHIEKRRDIDPIVERVLLSSQLCKYETPSMTRKNRI